MTVSGAGVPAAWLDLVRDAVTFALEAEEAPNAVEVGVALLDETAMTELNERYAGRQGATDVLAFPCEAPDEARPAGAEIALGDIAICPAVAQEQAGGAGGNIDGELQLLAVHGLLHLLGYEHDRDESARAMEQRQTEILVALRGRPAPGA